MPLTNWSGFVAANPTKAQQLTQVLICAVGSDNDVYPMPVDATSGGLPVFITPTPREQANAPHRIDYVGTPVTTAAYTTVVASTAKDINTIQIFDSSGETLMIATGGAGSESDLFLIPPGGIDVEVFIAAGTRISVKAVSNNATSGEADYNFWK